LPPIPNGASKPLKIRRTEAAFSTETPVKQAAITAAQTFSKLCFPGKRISETSTTGTSPNSVLSQTFPSLTKLPSSAASLSLLT